MNMHVQMQKIALKRYGLGVKKDELYQYEKDEKGAPKKIKTARPFI